MLGGTTIPNWGDFRDNGTGPLHNNGQEAKKYCLHIHQGSVRNPLTKFTFDAYLEELDSKILEEGLKGHQIKLSKTFYNDNGHGVVACADKESAEWVSHTTSKMALGNLRLKAWEPHDLNNMFRMTFHVPSNIKIDSMQIMPALIGQNGIPGEYEVITSKHKDSKSFDRLFAVAISPEFKDFVERANRILHFGVNTLKVDLPGLERPAGAAVPTSTFRPVHVMESEERPGRAAQGSKYPTLDKIPDPVQPFFTPSSFSRVDARPYDTRPDPRSPPLVAKREAQFSPLYSKPSFAPSFPRPEFAPPPLFSAPRHVVPRPSFAAMSRSAPRPSFAAMSRSAPRPSFAAMSRSAPHPFSVSRTKPASRPSSASGPRSAPRPPSISRSERKSRPAKRKSESQPPPPPRTFPSEEKFWQLTHNARSRVRKKAVKFGGPIYGLQRPQPKKEEEEKVPSVAEGSTTSKAEATAGEPSVGAPPIEKSSVGAPQSEELPGGVLPAAKTPAGVPPVEEIPVGVPPPGLTPDEKASVGVTLV